MNMRRLFAHVWVLILGFAIVASEARSQNPPPAQPQEDTLPALSVPKDYHYVATGRRDPFVNPIPKPKTPPPAPGQAPPPTVRPPGLKGVLVAEARVAGVVTSPEPSMNIVIISAPGARAPYFARVGDELYDATVKSIKLDAITFAVKGSAAGDSQSKDLIRQVRPTPGEEK